MCSVALCLNIEAISHYTIVPKLGVQDGRIDDPRVKGLMFPFAAAERFELRLLRE